MSDRTCSLATCDSPIHARELCNRHYKQKRKPDLGPRLPTGTCPHCGEMFEQNLRYRPRVYCTPKCQNAARDRRKQASGLRRRLYERHRERQQATQRAWIAANKERHREYQRQYRKRYDIDNPFRRSEESQRRRARMLGGDSRKVTDRDIRRMWLAYDNRCAYCGVRGEKLEVDHVIPLARGGRHAIGNIVPACRTCNGRKCERLLIEFRHGVRAKRARRNAEKSDGEAAA